MNPSEVILSIGASGGSLTILGSRDPDGGWHFVRERNEGMHADLLSEEDREGLVFHSRDGCVTSFAAALDLLNEYPWHLLYPLGVHPEFREAVYEAVVNRTKADGGRNMNLYEWKQECGMPLD